MKTHHTPTHWLLVALVLAAFLLTLGEAHGQSGVQQVAQGNEAADTSVAARKEVAPARDQGVAKDQRSAVKKSKRAVKRTITRARHGTSEIDSSR